MATKRLTASFSLYPAHLHTLKRIAGELDVNESFLLREIIEKFSDTHGIWDDCIIRFEKPKFRWPETGRFVE